MVTKQAGWAGVYFQRQHTLLIEALRWGIAAVTVDLGVIALVRQSRLRDALESWIDIHVLFGLMLIGFSILSFGTRRRRGPLSAADIREQSRWLSRMVYLMMYAIIGLRELLGMLGLVGSEQVLRPGLAFTNDLHALALSALAALVTIRVVMYRMWLHASAPNHAAPLASAALSCSAESCSPVPSDKHGATNKCP